MQGLSVDELLCSWLHSEMRSFSPYLARTVFSGAESVFCRGVLVAETGHRLSLGGSFSFHRIDVQGEDVRVLRINPNPNPNP